MKRFDGVEPAIYVWDSRIEGWTVGVGYLPDVVRPQLEAALQALVVKVLDWAEDDESFTDVRNENICDEIIADILYGLGLEVDDG